MPFQMIASVMEDALSFLKCSRRKQTLASPTTKHVSSDCDTDDTSKSTEPGDLSYNDFSDWSEHAAGSTDGSDTEVFQRKYSYVQYPVRGWPNSKMGSPPGLAMTAPPGLEAPPGLGGGAMQAFRQTQVCQGTRLNSHAKVFVPSFATPAPEAPTVQNNSTQLRQSIRLLKQSLEHWEADHFCDQQIPSDQGEGHTMFALREALNRLTPQDAAMVKAFIDSKAPQPTPFNPSSLAQPVQAMLAAPVNFAAMDASHLLQAHTPGLQFPPGQLYGDEYSAKTASRWTGGNTLQQSQHYAARPRGERNSRVAKSVPRGKGVIDDSPESLSTHLRDLSMLDNARVIMVRKINQLGMEPTAALEAHFSKFGTIDRVMVSATRTKSAHGTAARVRPATVGFLVMSDAGAVDAAVACGEQHTVQGVSVVVSRFQSHSIDEKH